MRRKKEKEKKEGKWDRKKIERRKEMGGGACWQVGIRGRRGERKEKESGEYQNMCIKLTVLDTWQHDSVDRQFGSKLLLAKCQHDRQFWGETPAYVYSYLDSRSMNLNHIHGEVDN